MFRLIPSQTVNLVAVVIVVIISLIPFEDQFYLDFVALGGPAFLALAMYMVILTSLVQSDDVEVDDIKNSFQNQPSDTLIYHHSLGENNNPLNLRVDKREINIYTSPEANNLLKRSIRKAIFTGTGISPLLVFGFFYVRSMFYETEMFFVYAMTIFVYIAFGLSSIIIMISMRPSSKSSNRIIQIAKKGINIEIAARISKHQVINDNDYNDLVVSIPVGSFESELFVDNITDIISDNKKKLSKAGKIRFLITRKMVRFAPTLTVDMSSNDVDVIRRPQVKKFAQKPLSDKLLIFGLHDEEVINSLREEIITWAKS